MKYFKLSKEEILIIECALDGLITDIVQDGIKNSSKEWEAEYLKKIENLSNKISTYTGATYLKKNKQKND